MSDLDGYYNQQKDLYLIQLERERDALQESIRRTKRRIRIIAITSMVIMTVGFTAWMIAPFFGNNPWLRLASAIGIGMMYAFGMLSQLEVFNKNGKQEI